MNSPGLFLYCHDFAFTVLSPAGHPDARLPVAACRAGALGVLDLAFCAAEDTAAARAALADLARHGHGRFGVQVAGEALLTIALDAAPDAVLLAPGADPLAAMIDACHAAGARAVVVATDVDRAVAGAAAGADAVVAKGHEAGGFVGDESTFVLLQRIVGAVDVPVWAQGGVGTHTAAGCLAGGAAGAVLDAQVLLARESPINDAGRALLAGLDGSETSCLGAELGAAFRSLSRPDLPGAVALTAAEGALRRAHGSDPGAADRWRATAVAATDWRRPTADVLAVGQDACFAAPLARTGVTVAGILDALHDAAIGQCRSAAAAHPLAEGAPLAAAHGTRFPVVQGPMTRVSDMAGFAGAVAAGGGLPFLALALLRAAEAGRLLEETAREAGDRPWGVGVLGFVPAALREEQLAVIREHKPPFALIAGGRPVQAKALEDDGIPTYLHVPSPGLLGLYLREGARRFVFEGRECGGHVGPRTSFVLWESVVRTLLEQVAPGDAADVHVLLAGGIHDARSAAMAAAIAAPLTERGMRVGVLAGTGYLFTREAVEHGAITAGFQEAALAADRTVFLESGPGHATRCLASPFADEFAAERQRLHAEGLGSAEARQALEELNIGRLRIASKGVDRNPDAGADPTAPKLVALSDEEQWRRGMYMIGQVAALHDAVGTIAGFHEDLCAGSCALLDALDLPEPAAEPAPEPADIAIVGMSCILPQAPDLATFWGNVLGGVDAVTEVPPDRFDAGAYFDPDRTARDKAYSRWGGFIPDVPFDPVAYGMPPNSLRSIEPFQLLGLHMADAALRDAGYAERPFPRERTSVILGAGGGGAALGVGYTVRSTMPMLFGDSAAPVVEALDGALPEWTEDSFAGLLMNVAAGRIANRLDLGGSNATVDAACASSLAAVAAAVRELRAGTADMVLAGGVDAIQTPFAYLCFAKTQALSPRGRCRPFDAEADGIAISEGFACLVLKRLEDAERDGDRVYAVIRGVGAASDGRDRSLTAPRPEGQMRALRRAYAHAGFSPATVGLVEAHGTGTVAGDGAEVQALTRVFAEAGAPPETVAIGSVKSMIGHTKATAGVAGMVKAALALHHGVLPPTLGVTTPNPKAGFGNGPFYVSGLTRPWVHDGADHPRRAAVSAFGFGGTNFHVVLEEHTGAYGTEPTPALDRWPAELFAWRAETREALGSAVDRLLAQLDEGLEPPLTDLAHTLALDLAAAPAGPALAVVAGSHAELAERLRAARATIDGTAEREHATPGVHFAAAPIAGPEGVAFLFPGQGSQHVGMLRDLAVMFPAVRGALDVADGILADALERPLSTYVYPPPTFGDETLAARRADELTATDVAQPALGAVELGCLRLLRSLGVAPAMTAGHSYGEFVALAAAGCLAEDELLRLSAARGRFIREGAAGGDAGAMVAVSAAPDALAELLGEDLVVANRNAPQQTVLSGSAAAVERALAWCAERGIGAQRLPVACAFHSAFVAPAQERLAERLRATPIAAPRIPVFSNETAAPYPDDAAAVAQRLAAHLVRPVDFAGEVEAMHDAGARIFVECGPRTVLSGLVRRTLGERPHVCAALDRGGRDGTAQLLDCLATLVAEGVPVDLPRLFAGRTARRISQVPISPTTWMVNGAHAWPAGAPRQPVTPVPIAVVDPDHHRSTAVSVTNDVPANGHRAGPVPAAAPAPQAAPAPPAAAPPPERAADVMGRYQEVMQQFLDTERSVMLAFLGQDPGPAAAPAPRSSGNGHVAPAVAAPVVAAAAAPAPVALPAPVPESVTPAPATEPAPVPTAAAPAATPAPPPTGGSPALTAEALRTQLLAVVSERTGYPPDMLDLDADLEGDLSIDSIKRVEIAGTLLEQLPGADPAAVDMERMTASRTLNEVLEALAPLLGGRAGDAAAATPVAAGEGDGHPFVDEPADGRIGRFVLHAVRARAAAGDAGLAAEGAIVLVDDGGEVGVALTSRLRADGHAVVRVVPGSGRFARGAEPAAGEDVVVADVTDAAAAAAVAARVGELHGRATALVHLGALGDGAADVSVLFLLAQALRDGLERAAGDGGAAVLGATAMGGTFGADGEVPASAPRHGLVTGFLKTLAHEWPAVRVRAVDLEPDAPADAQAAALAAELLTADGLLEAGHRGGERWTVEPAPTPVDGREDAGLLPDDAVLLVTGGARGITAEAAIALAAASTRPTVVLVGRTPLTAPDPRFPDDAEPAALKQALIAELRRADPGITPRAIEAEHRRLLGEREVRRTVARLRAAGATADVRPCDVRDADAFGALVDDVYAVHGRIDGAIHGAGLIEDKLVADKDLASFGRVLATKVTGASVLAQRLRPEQLRFLVLFSSVSGRFGNRGQADYAAASDALDKFAQALDRRWPARVVAVEWGPWLATGMVSAAVQKQFAERGVALIDVPTGCRRLEEELRFGRKGEAEVVIGGTAGFEAPRALLAAEGTVETGDGAAAVRRRFDVGVDRYLGDHRLDGRPVVPFAVATELMAETAAAAAGARIAELTEIRLLHGIDVPDEGLGVVVSAGAAGEVTIAADDDPRRLRYRARAVVGAPPAAAAPAPLTDLAPFPMAVEDAYRELLFHGPLFRCIAAIEGMDARGARAILRPSAPAEVLAGAGSGHWWADPIAVDGALQVQVLWARLNWDVTLLPAQIGRVRVFAPLDADELHLDVRLRPGSRAPLCHMDHVLRAPDGRVLAVMEDVVGTGSKALNRLASAAGAASS